MGIFRNIDLLLFIIENHRDYSIISLWEGPLLVNCVNTTHSSPFYPNVFTPIGACHLRNRTFLVSNLGKVTVIGNSKIKVVKSKRLSFPPFIDCLQLVQFTLSKIKSVVNKNKLRCAKYCFHWFETEWILSGYFDK